MEMALNEQFLFFDSENVSWQVTISRVEFSSLFALYKVKFMSRSIAASMIIVNELIYATRALFSGLLH